MKVENENFLVDFIPSENTVKFNGSLRLNGMKEYEPILEILDQGLQEANSPLILDLTSLDFLNSSGISMFSKFVIKVRNQQKINLIIMGSQKIPWQSKSLKNLQRLMPSLVLEIV
ncbi:slr1659 superfamily regulator [Geminocystis sp. GBBB08]|uniref:slr1659 superfamily regulator n=1 Tax=Geminocystis sp. GBBB08 TaxID=2604140 RepID=UPI0027E3549B|nr:STAS domain-containing protein [Geminocystis sp. GBBB08]MBL1208747.1 hypothetical protein [Geminocystis sp. GBBB08]